MSEMRFTVTITAVGEVRDAEGNLISSTPIETSVEVSESELEGLAIPTRTTDTPPE